MLPVGMLIQDTIGRGGTQAGADNSEVSGEGACGESVWGERTRCREGSSDQQQDPMSSRTYACEFHSVNGE